MEALAKRLQHIVPQWSPGLMAGGRLTTPTIAATSTRCRNGAPA